MSLNPVASGILVAFYFISVLIFVGAMVAIAIALTKLNEKLDTLSVQVEPLLQKADSILATTDEKVKTIGQSAETIMVKGEETADSLQDKVETTTTSVQKVIHAPIITANSLWSGVAQGWNTFTKLQQKTTEKAALPETITHDTSMDFLATAEKPVAIATNQEN